MTRGIGGGKKQASIIDIFNPPARLIAKIGSILVHFEEAVGEGGHAYDWTAARSLLADREVQEWLAGLRAHALVPVKR